MIKKKHLKILKKKIIFLNFSSNKDFILTKQFNFFLINDFSKKPNFYFNSKTNYRKLFLINYGSLSN
jgi:hypothetical protein